MLLLLGLPFFFIYIFPVFFLWEDQMYTKPWVATFFLVLGIVLWTIKGLMVFGLIRLPHKLKKRHLKVQETGKLVQAKILSNDTIGEDGEYPVVSALLEFENLAGSKVKAVLNTTDTKPEERRFEVGKYIDLKLNKDGYDPAYTVATAEYRTGSRFVYWVWLIFDIVYGIGLFLISYKLHNNGMGWRFLNPVSPWIISPAMGIFMMGLINKVLHISEDTTQGIGYEFYSSSKRDDMANVLLNGKTTYGTVLSFNQTGTYINKQPQLRFYIEYENEYGDLVKANHKQIISLTELHNLKRDMIEVVYIPGNKNMYMFNYVD